MKWTKIVVCVFIIGFLFACGSKKRAVQKTAETQRIQKQPEQYSSEEDYPDNIVEVREEPEVAQPTFKSQTERYIYKYAPIAKREMELYGIPASITLAQGILESGSGKGELTQKSNNHFGIKCNGWQGAKAYHDDDRAQECFRKYKDPKYSFRDHSLFLAKRRRYAFLFTFHKDDYEKWAHGLKKAGYATDPRYPEKLISLIERYDLDRFDNEVLGDSSRKGRPLQTAQVDYSGKRHIVKNGDTLWSIAKRYNLTVEQLKSFNNLRSNKIDIGQKLYVQTH